MPTLPGGRRYAGDADDKARVDLRTGGKGIDRHGDPHKDVEAGQIRRRREGGRHEGDLQRPGNGGLRRQGRAGEIDEEIGLEVGSCGEGGIRDDDDGNNSSRLDERRRGEGSIQTPWVPMTVASTAGAAVRTPAATCVVVRIRTDAERPGAGARTAAATISRPWP
jgi:hypothetical protein